MARTKASPGAQIIYLFGQLEGPETRRLVFELIKQEMREPGQLPQRKKPSTKPKPLAVQES